MQFTAWPEMLAWPYLILKGFLPYKDIAIAHNPLLIFVLTIFYKIFGVGIFQLQIFTVLLIFFTVLLIYCITYRLYSKKTAILTVIAYSILLIAYGGLGLWFDLALVPFAILLFYFIKKDLPAGRQGNWFMAGIIFALGFLTKQTFIYFLIPLLINKVDVKKFVFGVVSIFSLFTLYLLTFNLLPDYYHWAIQFGIFYLPHAEGQVLLPNLRQFIIAFFPLLVFIGNLKLGIWYFALAGMMGVYPRFEFFHFQPALPFLALALALSFENKRTKIYSILIMIFLLILLGRNLIRQRNLETRFYESDVQKVVSQLTVHRSLSTIYVVNYWDNIYALTNTTPPKPLIPYIPWYLNYSNNKQLIINNLQVKLPDVLVVNELKNLKWQELEVFIGRYYKCNLVEKEVEVCFKN